MEASNSYNLATNEAKARLAVAQRELAEAITERDRVRNEIADQRRGISAISSEVRSKESEKVSILAQLEQMAKTLEASRNNFVGATEKETEFLNRLERSIEEKRALESGFLVKSEELERISAKLSEKTAEFREISAKAAQVSEETEKLLKSNAGARFEIENAKRELEETRKRLDDYRDALERRESELNFRQKRYDGMKKKEKLRKTEK